MVLLDMMYPVAGGSECLRKIKEEYPAIKTVLYTGYSLSEESEKMINAGVHGFIYKPFDRAHLSQVIAKVLTST
jgi:DNA-binding NarL/FixJ family response regulator